MRRAISLMAIVAVLLSLSRTASSTIWHIHPDSAVSSIQAGIDSSFNGDTVLVYPETYVENINFNGKNIVVGSLFLTTGDTSYISSTVIDGNSAGSVVTFAGGENSSAVITGFRIQNGFAIWRGGGVKCHDASPRLINLAISGNIAVLGGGVCCSYGSSPSLSGVSISDNTGHNGGGIHCEYDSDASLTNVTIRGNHAMFSGGGGSCYRGSSLNLTNAAISGNTANMGGAIHCIADVSVSLVNCILWNNTPEEVYFDSSDAPNAITVSYSDMQGDSAGIVTNDNGTIYWLEGNIDEDPLFVGNGEHPFALAEGSPCIDSGTPDTAGLGLPPWDILGNHRIWDGDGNGTAIIDMGAYEYGAPAVAIGHEVVVEPTTHVLLGNHPNPFSPQTTIRYSLSEDRRVSLKVYSLLGQEIRVLVEKFQHSGIHQAIWDATDNSGRKVPSGNYFVRLEAKDYTATRKLCVVR